jgi:prepilin peptidase CpaA
MPIATPSLPACLLLVLCTIAAITDLRRGLIPNWLTLPPLLLAPPALALVHGPGALAASLLGALLCGIVPLLLFLRGGMGGGDVKLLAAAGAIAGPGVGLELQLSAYLAAMLHALCMLSWRGQLLSSVAAAPRALREPGAASGLEIRLGPPAAVAAVLLVISSVWGA